MLSVFLSPNRKPSNFFTRLGDFLSLNYDFLIYSAYFWFYVNSGPRIIVLRLVIQLNRLTYTGTNISFHAKLGSQAKYKYKVVSLVSSYYQVCS